MWPGAAFYASMRIVTRKTVRVFVTRFLQDDPACRGLHLALGRKSRPACSRLALSMLLQAQFIVTLLDDLDGLLHLDHGIDVDWAGGGLLVVIKIGTAADVSLSELYGVVLLLARMGFSDPVQVP